MIVAISFFASIVVLIFLVAPLFFSAISDSRENEKERKQLGNCLFNNRCPIKRDDGYRAEVYDNNTGRYEEI